MIFDSNIRMEAVLNTSTSTTQLSYHVSFRDRNKNGEYAEPGLKRGATNNSTAVIILEAPGDNNPRREVESLTVYNSDFVPAVVTIQSSDGTTARPIVRKTLLTTEALVWTKSAGWQVFGA